MHAFLAFLAFHVFLNQVVRTMLQRTTPAMQTLLESLAKLAQVAPLPPLVSQLRVSSTHQRPHIKTLDYIILIVSLRHMIL